MTVKTELNKALDRADNYASVLVIGFTHNGQVDFLPSTPTYGFTHHALNKATFQLNMMENQQVIQAAHAAEEAKEAEEAVEGV